MRTFTMLNTPENVEELNYYSIYKMTYETEPKYIVSRIKPLNSYKHHRNPVMEIYPNMSLENKRSIAIQGPLIDMDTFHALKLLVPVTASILLRRLSKEYYSETRSTNA